MTFAQLAVGDWFVWSDEAAQGQAKLLLKVGDQSWAIALADGKIQADIPGQKDVVKIAH